MNINPALSKVMAIALLAFSRCATAQPILLLSYVCVADEKPSTLRYELMSPPVWCEAD